MIFAVADDVVTAMMIGHGGPGFSEATGRGTVQPTVEFRYFHPLKYISKDDEKPDVFGMRFLAGHIRSFGTPLDVNSLSFINGTPIFARYFLGGEENLRGYGVRTISPVTSLQQFVTTNSVVAYNIHGKALDVVRPRDGNRHTIAPGVINTYTFDDQALTLIPQYTPIGADTQVLLNAEYRVPIAGPVSAAAFMDVGSAFNITSLQNQETASNFLPATLTPFGITLNPRGQLATAQEIKDATTPETPPGQLPKGFRPAVIRGMRQDTTVYYLSTSNGSFSDGFRYSVGAELRVQVPVVNVPFRLIFAYNPNAVTDFQPGQIYLEKRTNFLFSIGRTF